MRGNLTIPFLESRYDFFSLLIKNTYVASTYCTYYERATGTYEYITVQYSIGKLYFLDNEYVRNLAMKAEQRQKKQEGINTARFVF